MTKSNSQCASDLKKDKQFIGQIPEWEESYKQSDDLLIRYTQDDWKAAKAVYSEHDLQILGEPVMEDWEEPYMRVLADIATSQGGTIVEVGYGMGISARLIQAKPIQKHIIIEANKEVASVAREWAASCKYETVILEGLWQEVIGELADESIEGILFDTYPLTEKELYQNHFSFFTHAFAKLKQGGCFTYYSDETSWFSEFHVAELQKAGFSGKNITGRVVPVSPPETCEYWKAATILAPIIIK